MALRNLGVFLVLYTLRLHFHDQLVLLSLPDSLSARVPYQKMFRCFAKDIRICQMISSHGFIFSLLLAAKNMCFFFLLKLIKRSKEFLYLCSIYSGTSTVQQIHHSFAVSHLSLSIGIEWEKQNYFTCVRLRLLEILWEHSYLSSIKNKLISLAHIGFFFFLSRM